MSELAGKNALVTGASGGLGSAIAARLAAAGCNVVLSDREPGAEVLQLCGCLQEAHAVTALFVPADLRELDATLALIDTACDRVGRIDILVNNAVVRHFAPIEEFATAWWNDALAVNVSAAFHLIRRALPAMRQGRYGRIINMASVYGLRATLSRVDYVTSKAALIGLTRAVALETARDGVTCNAVCPGAVLTAYGEGKIVGLMQANGLSREAATESFLEGKQPTGRFVAAADVAELIAFLCGGRARDITGAVLPVDAGWLAS
jgi:3-hydroxybutyrate dehydrogenase